MSFRKTFKTIALTLVLTSSTLPMAAQDLIAKMAPVDRKVKALDTLALNTIKERENMESPSADLYQDWDNRFAHKATELPETYRIDLRGFHMPTSSRVITSQFGPRWGRQHKGLDIKVTTMVWRPSTATSPSTSCVRIRWCVPDSPSALAATPAAALAHTSISKPAFVAWRSIQHSSSTSAIRTSPATSILSAAARWQASRPRPLLPVGRR